MTTWHVKIETEETTIDTLVNAKGIEEAYTYVRDKYFINKASIIRVIVEEQ